MVQNWMGRTADDIRPTFFLQTSMTALCQVCRNLNIRLDTFIETGWRYPTSLRYQTIDDVFAGGFENGQRHYAPNEYLDANSSYSDEELGRRIPSPDYEPDFDEDGHLLNPKPPKRLALGTLDEIRERSRSCYLCRPICCAIDSKIYRKSFPDTLTTRQEPVGSDKCKISFDYDGQGSNATRDLLGLDKSLRYGRYDCEVSIGGDFTFHLLPVVDRLDLKWFGARLYGEQINFGLACRWLRTCEDSHERCGARTWHSLLEPLSRLRFIDVDDECLVESSGEERFIALSYVWGQTPMFKTTLEHKSHLHSNGGLRKFSHEVSRTVRDAIQVTKALGERYLWTDAICIVQDDPVEKAYLISNMDAVYARAVLTIVAAEGASADAGLPGVSPGTRPAPEVSSYKPDLDLCLSRASLSEVILDCPWSKRAWTYQEALMSARLLVFTNETVHFACNSTTWSENINALSENTAPPWPFAASALYYFSATLANIEASSSRMPEDDREELWSLWQTVASEISERSLTFEQDILFASAGLIHLLEKRFKMKSIYGLPTTNLEKALFWSPMQPGELRRRTDADGKPFCSSWSWAGWVGEVAWMEEYQEVAEVSQDGITWAAAEKPGSTPVLVEDVGRSEHDQQFPYIHFTTQSSRFRISRRGPAPDWVQELQPYAWSHVLPEGEVRKGVHCVMGLGQIREPVGSVILDSDDYLDGVDEAEADFIIVSSTPMQQDVGEYVNQVFYHVLAVQRQDGIALRIGHGSIVKELWEKSGWERERIVLG
jgi:Heterokaryon incompatibility protein (HET)